MGGLGPCRLLRSVAAVVVILTAAGVGSVVTSAPASASGSVTPVLECVWHVSSTSWTSLWGYGNSTGSTLSISIGSNNYFTPGAQNQGQPTSFSTGTVNNLFTVPFDASSPPTWYLDGSSVSAPTSDKKCSSDPVPIVAGTGGWTGQLPLVFVALGILVVGLYLWRHDRALLALGRADSRRAD